MTLEYFLTSFVVVLLPGTGIIYTLAIGLGQGFKASVAAAVGCTFGIVPAAFASIVGLAALLHTSAVLFQGVKILGVLYLFYMAWSILKEDGSLSVSGDTKRTGYFKVALNGAMLNVFNPKLSLFFLAFLPQFVSSQVENQVVELSVLAGIFMLMTFVVFVAYGAGASLAREYVISRPAVLLWMRRLFAGSFAFLGLRMALSEQ